MLSNNCSDLLLGTAPHKMHTSSRGPHTTVPLFLEKDETRDHWHKQQRLHLRVSQVQAKHLRLARNLFGELLKRVLLV